VGRIKLHRTECDQGWPRFVSLTLLVLLFGSFSCLITWQVAIETSAAICAPLAQANLMEWTAERWSQSLPLAVALVGLPVLAALTIGVHTLWEGGMLGFLVCLFNLLPLCSNGGGLDVSRLCSDPILLGSFLGGLLLAFYAGDLGSWICRRRLRQEVREDEIEVLERRCSSARAS
jgi:hypothetical protein